jgi:hypothetical protein
MSKVQTEAEGGGSAGCNIGFRRKPGNQKSNFQSG